MLTEPSLHPDKASLSIGYVPYSPDCNGPADRRRFCHYAEARAYAYEIANPAKYYDLVVLSGAADFSVWSKRPRELGKIVLDLTDPYLSEPDDLRKALKGPMKFLAGRWKNWEWSFKEALHRMCRRADGIACSTPEQREALESFNPNVVDVLDIHDREISTRKECFVGHSPFRLVWEGVGDSLYGFREVAGVLGELTRTHPVELHLLTDLRFRRMNRLFYSHTRPLVDKLLPGVRCYLYEWNQSLLSTIATNCDLAILPVDTSNPMVRDKAENRLMIFWRMGIPCVTSVTPSYKRVFDSCQVDGCFSGEGNWYKGLRDYVSSQERRVANIEKGRRYIETHLNRDKLLQKWDQLFGRVVNPEERTSGF